jgi:hypothetical protein
MDAKGFLLARLQFDVVDPTSGVLRVYREFSEFLPTSFPGPQDLRFEKDAAGRIIRVWRTTLGGVPPIRTDYTYDDRTGFVTGIFATNADGIPVAAFSGGNSAYRIAYKGNGSLSRVQRFDPDGVSRWSADGIDPPGSFFTMTGDGSTWVNFIDAENRPSADRAGITAVHFQITDGIVSELSRYGVDGAPIPPQSLCHSLRYE